MELAKQSLDIGLYVTDAGKSRSFYEGEVGLDYEELLPVGGGTRQHRLALRGSVLKLNESRNDLPHAASGYRRLLIAADRAADLIDPDGVAVSLVEPGSDGIDKIGIEVASADREAHGRF